VTRRRDPFALVHVLVASAVATLLVAIWVFVDLHGWSYYTTPLRIRGYAPGHAALKPSGHVAHLLGVIGLAMMTVPVVYSVRKQWPRLANAGSLATWLEVHIFCGIVGPVLVTFHSSFKFNGLISVAYWSMVLVALSGFVGRYLYVRIPRTIRGVELSREDIERRAAALTQNLSAPAEGGPLGRLHDARADTWWARRRLRRALVAAGADPATARTVTEAMAERDALTRRLRHLARRQRLFAAWHVFHLPLVYVMFGIAALHVALAIYMGYSFF
jgi:hypothetical protein